MTCPLSTLTPDQQASFKTLRATVDEKWAPTLTPPQLAWLNDKCLLRYLRARKYNVEKASQMLKSTMNWRATHAPAAISHKQVMDISTHKSNYIHMTSDEGHPICYMRFARDPRGFNDKDKLEYIKFTLEEATRVMKYNESRFPNIEKIIYIIDLKGFSLSAPGANRDIASRWGEMLQYHYPERLHKAYLVNYPAIFSVFWSAVKLFIDSVTASKVKFVSHTSRSSLRTYFEAEGFNLSWLEKEYGGDLEPLDRPNFIGQRTYEHDPMVLKDEEELAAVRERHYKFLKKEKRDRTKIADGKPKKEKKEKKEKKPKKSLTDISDDTFDNISSLNGGSEESSK
eukprot:TRINITY_DN10732_c0_g1_i1.p1 TRINITY_DN10732_c0_g1~~TRINITY_DN10732_c0_g1_i1.p1  ORF type:complete len:360 (+),score=86.83 TRINITY_DN10732_c0_g1_i1:58-1080(+)